MNQSLVQLMT